MNRLLTMHDKVEYVLTEYPITRDDDRLTICAVYTVFYDADLNRPFKDIMRDKNLPNFETIRRCRQKVQADPGGTTADRENQERQGGRSFCGQGQLPDR